MTEEKKEENPSGEAEDKGVTPDAKKLLLKIKGKSEDLYIKRIPPDTKKEFVEWANEKFCGDYGMALKWLLDDMPKGDIKTVLEIQENHEERIQAVEKILSEAAQVEEKPKKRNIKMVDGKTTREVSADE